MQVELAPDAVKRLRAALRDAGRREVGGMLFAEQLRPAVFRIVDFSIDPLSGSRAHFVRDPANHRAALAEFLRRTNNDFVRFNYLGEWHSHPSFPVHPSAEDLSTMTELVGNTKSDISFALLLIVRLRFFFWVDHSMTVFVRGHQPFPAKPRTKLI
jgi:proteasome lid subunit RPN8/RPN11